MHQLSHKLEVPVPVPDPALQDTIRRLARETATLHAVLESLACGVIVSNPEGQFTIFNEAASEILGLGSTDLPMSEWAEHYGIYRAGEETPVPAHELPLVRALTGEDVKDETLVLRNPNLDGDRWLSVSARRVEDDGDILGAVVVFNDITPSTTAYRAQALLNRKLEQSNEELENFAYVASHDLQEPLRMVASYMSGRRPEWWPTADSS